jgi:hypothetical protein
MLIPLRHHQMAGFVATGAMGEVSTSLIETCTFLTGSVRIGRSHRLTHNILSTLNNTTSHANPLDN